MEQDPQDNNAQPGAEKKPKQPAKSDYPLSPRMQALIDRDQKNDQRLYEAYKAIQDRAKKGERITGASFLWPEIIHHLRTKGLSKHDEPWEKIPGSRDAIYDEAFKESRKISGMDKFRDEQIDFQASDNPTLSRMQELWMDLREALYTAHNNKISENILDAADGEKEKKMKAWLESHPDIARAQNFPTALDDAYLRDYAAHAPRKNLELKPDTKTEWQFTAELLGKNPGIVVGDIHTLKESWNYVTRNMPVFAASGVKGITVEMPAAYLDEYYNALTIPQLQTLLKEGEVKYEYKGREHTATLGTAYETSQLYGTRYAEDVDRTFIEALLAAKTYNIPMYGKDERLAFEGVETLDHRVSRTNYVWTDYIHGLQKKMGPGGKFVDVGGLAHYTNWDNAKGLIDEGLGAPVLGFTRSAPGAPAFERATSPNGPDFYLPGGPHYESTKAYIAISDVKDIAKYIAKYPAAVPFAPIVSLGLYGAAEGAKKYLEDKDYGPSELPPPPPTPKTPAVSKKER